MDDLRLVKIIKDIKEKFSCHTIILYGSHARGEASDSSDYDIVAIREKGEIERDCRIFEGAYLDIFIYPEEAVEEPDVSFVRMKDGIVLCQKQKVGEELIKKVKEIYQKGPLKIPNWEKQVIKTWSDKMLARAKIGDIEGDFRRHWLLFDLLEAYFRLRDSWYLGPKESFQWLKKNDSFTYSLFEKALKPSADLDSLKNLIDRVKA